MHQISLITNLFVLDKLLFTYFIDAYSSNIFPDTSLIYTDQGMLYDFFGNFLNQHFLSLTQNQLKIPSALCSNPQSFFSASSKFMTKESLNLKFPSPVLQLRLTNFHFSWVRLFFLSRVLSTLPVISEFLYLKSMECWLQKLVFFEDFVFCAPGNPNKFWYVAMFLCAILWQLLLFEFDSIRLGKSTNAQSFILLIAWGDWSASRQARSSHQLWSNFIYLSWMLCCQGHSQI